MSNPWMKFYPSDWRSDPMLRLCSLAARGLWLEMICLMHESVPYGLLLVNGKQPDRKQLASLVGVSEKECTALLVQLEDGGVFSRDEDGTIYSRRMRRDADKIEKDKANGKLGGAPDLVGGIPKNDRDRRFSRKDNPTKVEAVWVASQGKCEACGCDMQRDYPNDPNAFTVDHIIALAQGGNNNMENLQGLCRSCNRRKGITPPDDKKELGGDKAQIPEARDQIPEKKAHTAKVAVARDEKFESAWQVYPKRDGGNPKAPAAKRFLSAVKAGADPQEIIEGIKRFAVAEQRNIGTPYIPQMVKWLGDQRWLDYGPDCSIVKFDVRKFLV